VKKIAFVLQSAAVLVIVWAIRLFPFQNSGYENYLYGAIGLAVAAAVIRIIARD
jgi:hypothetical protein